jgi:hypothetical protein
MVLALILNPSPLESSTVPVEAITPIMCVPKTAFIVSLRTNIRPKAEKEADYEANWEFTYGFKGDRFSNWVIQVIH